MRCSISVIVAIGLACACACTNGVLAAVLAALASLAPIVWVIGDRERPRLAPRRFGTLGGHPPAMLAMTLPAHEVGWHPIPSSSPRRADLVVP